MRAYWQNLQARERAILLGGGAVLVLLLLYLLVIEPWQQNTASLHQSIANQQETLRFVQQGAVEVKALRGSAEAGAGPSGQSLMGLVDSSARAAGIGSAIRQVRPDNQGVSVRLENAPFDDTLRWLGGLYREQAIRVDSFTMERLPESGRVNASVSLQR